MYELIKVESKKIGNEEINAVDARGLHAFLESKQQFSNWIQDRIKQYDFVQDTDFIQLNNFIKSDSKARKEYIISLDMAKELAMVERNKKGKEARKYFIECEKRLKNQFVSQSIPTQVAGDLEAYLKIADLFEIPKHLGQIEAKKQVEQIHKVNLSPFLQLAPAQNNIKEDEVMLEPTELAKELKIKSASAMNKILAHKGLQVKTELGWIATEKGQPYCSKHSWTSGTKSGYNYKWNAKKIKSLFSKGSLF